MSRLVDRKSPTFPERVGRHELLIPIGTGGMATVYLARVAVAGDVYCEVALKERSSATSLVEEAKLAVRIRHPNVVPVANPYAPKVECYPTDADHAAYRSTWNTRTR